jgi:Flp pilus assembly protein TadD
LAADANSPRPAAEAVSVSQVQHHPPKEARRALARAAKLRRANHHADAVAALEETVRIDPAFGEAVHWLGVEYAQTGRLLEAVASFRHLLELEPDNWRGHYNLGLALLQSGQFADAETSARRALQLAPADPNVNLLFGGILSFWPDRRKEARSYVEFAARKLPEARQFLPQLENH